MVYRHTSPTRKLIRVVLLIAGGLASTISVCAQCVGPRFNAAINIQAGAAPSDIASGDFNGDGRTDLAIPNFGSNTVSIFFGSASGLPTVQVVSIQAPIAVGVADFNHDTKLDLAVSRGAAFGPQFVAILMGDGVGGFGVPTDFSVTLTKPIVIADFNNDDNADIFLGNSSTNNSQILLGNGNGGFAPPYLVTVANNSEAVARDLNSDGKVDLVMVNDSNSFSVALGTGTGSFNSVTNFPISRARFIAVADLNSDAKLDLVAAGQSDGVSVLFGNGAGSFGAPTSFSTGFTTSTVAVGDFNGDGKPDVAATGGNIVSVFIGDGNGNLASRTDYALNQSPIDLQLGDLDGDGKLDVATANSPPSLPPLGGGNAPTDRGTLLFGDGTGRLEFASVIAGNNTSSVINADVNEDGKLDLIVGNGTNASVLFGDGAGSFGAAVNFPMGIPAKPIAVGDLNGDENIDLVAVSPGSNAISVLLGNGSAFGPPSVRNVPGFNANFAAPGDFNNDGRPDLIVSYRNSSFVSILLGDGAGGFGAATNFNVPSGAQHVALSDFNGDGKSDLSVATISGVSILLGNGTGGFGAASTLATPSTAWAVGVGDFNADGKADIATPVANLNAVFVYLGNGAGGFGAPANLSTGLSPSSIVVADFNGDANPDLATANGSGSTSVLLGDGTGGFSPAVNYLSGGLNSMSASSGDFNSDGRPDLAMANLGSALLTPAPNTVSVIFNSCSAAFPPTPTLSVDDISLTEGDSGTNSATFTLSLSAPSNRSVAVSLYAAANEATKGVDFQDVSGRVVFTPGLATRTFTVPVIGDLLDEFDERFNVFLVNPLNANISRARGQGTILDNDPPPTISISDASLPEGNAATTVAVFSVNLSTPSGKPISIAFATSDGSAINGSDYVATSGVVAFSVGEISKTISVQVNGDRMYEGNETFFVTLSNPNNVTISRAQAVGTIVTDDAILLLEQGTNHVVAIDSVTFVRDPFSVGGLHNFSPDQRTRVMIFTSNLGLTQPNSDLAVTAGGIPLAVEAVGALASVPDISYIIVKLDPTLTGDVQVAITFRGVTSNVGVISIRP